MQPRSHFIPLLVAAAILTLTSIAPVLAASPLDLQVATPRASANTVSTTIQLRDVLPDRFRKVVAEGGVLHLRVQTELWQSRPAWDRLVYPAIVRVLRFARGQTDRDVTVTDAGGTPATYTRVPNPMPLAVEIGGSERLSTSDKYYVHAVATLGMLADRETEEVGDALFGRESEAGALGSLGRAVFRSVLQVSDYLHSISVEARSASVAGREIMRK
jgi:hypothetical protein